MPHKLSVHATQAPCACRPKAHPGTSLLIFLAKQTPRKSLARLYALRAQRTHKNIISTDRYPGPWLRMDLPEHTDAFMWAEAEAYLVLLGKLHRFDPDTALGLRREALYENHIFCEIVEALILLEDLSCSRVAGPFSSVAMHSLRLGLVRRVLQACGVLHSFGTDDTEMQEILALCAQDHELFFMSGLGLVC